MKQEEYLDEEFGLLGVTPYISHFYPDMNMDGLPKGITTAMHQILPRSDILQIVNEVERIYGPRGRNSRVHSVASIVKQHIAALGVGVAVCDYRDQFSRKRGRIIAKGRLLKQLRKERLKRCI